MDDILKSTAKLFDQVTVEPDGKWSRISDGGPAASGIGRNDEKTSSDDEDLVEIKDLSRPSMIKNEGVSGFSAMKTPPMSSREQSSSSVAPSTAGTKRPIGQVVDLTLSSDEEEELQRTRKKTTIQTAPTSSSGYHSLQPSRPVGFGSLPVNPLPRVNFPGYPNPP